MKSKLLKAAELLNEASTYIGDAKPFPRPMDYKTYLEFRTELKSAAEKLVLSASELRLSIDDLLEALGEKAEEWTACKVKACFREQFIDLSDAIEESDHVEGENDSLQTPESLPVRFPDEWEEIPEKWFQDEERSENCRGGSEEGSEKGAEEKHAIGPAY